mmetsp:Transcript_11162/g.21947  ORF Transcript_11162/g.21947 Transcript_11162/m.21947 type:complete len:263 (-) Transcript_11162:108-896(-)
MGCTQSRSLEKPLSREEEILQEYEQNFGMSGLLAKDISEGVRFFSIDKLSKDELHEALANHGWKFNPFGDSTYLDLFLDECCLTSENQVDSKKVILLGLLLGIGTVETKASILFEICDLDVSEKVSGSELKGALKMLTNLALDEVPSFIEKNIQTEERRTLTKFRSMITKMKSTIVSHMIENFISGDEEIDKEDFIVVCQQTKAKYLTSSVGLRNFAIKSYLQVKEFDNILLSLKAKGETEKLASPEETMQLLKDLNSEISP